MNVWLKINCSFILILVIILAITGNEKMILPFLAILALLGIIGLFFVLIWFLSKTLKEARQSKKATDEWLDARKRLSDFLERFPYIGHPEAQSLLEEEIATYEKWLETHPYAKKDKEYLNMLLSVRNKKKKVTLRVI